MAHRRLQVVDAHAPVDLRLFGVRVEVPAEERDDLEELLLVVANGLGVLVRLPGEEELDVFVVEVGPLRGCGRPLLVEVQQDRQLHWIAGELVDIRLAAFLPEALPQRATVPTPDPADGAPLAQVTRPLLAGQLV